MGHEAFEISPIVALMVYIVDEANALLHLCHVLKECLHIEHRLKRVLRNELGIVTNKLWINSLMQILDKVERPFHKEPALGIKPTSVNFRRKNTAPL